MSTLFYDSFQNTNNWVGGNGQSPTITVVNDPKGEYQRVVNFGAVRSLPDSFSNIISNSYKSFTITFDYLGLPKDQITAIYLGGLVSVADGASLTSATIAHGGAIKNAYPPIYGNYLCYEPVGHYGACYTKFYTKIDSFTFFTDDSEWHHYSITFTTNNNNIRIALADFTYANSLEGNNAGDCYFANLLVTDSYGPSPFIATSSPENFRSISVDVLNTVADTISYVNSNSAVNVNLGSGTVSGGYAEGDVLNDIVNVIGSNYNDNLLGGDKDNTLTGGNGNDNLTAGKGNDTLVGGSGNDKFIISSDITKAIISDFSTNDDVIDLRFFTNFYNLQTIINSSSYTNGNTVINLGNGKTLTLNGINYNDLKESSFLLTTLAPTFHPTFLPSLQPTLAPTFQPSFVPTIQPSSPTSKPTLIPTRTPTLNPTLSPTSFPTLTPSIAPSNIPTIMPSNTPSVSPTLSPSVLPTVEPSFVPSSAPTSSPSNVPSVTPSVSPTFSPSCIPTYSPTVSAKPTMEPTRSPTPHPTSKGGYHEINIDESSSDLYLGTEVADKFLISIPGSTTITGGGGADYYVVFNNLDSTLIINDFDVSALEKIELTDFPNLHSVKDLNPTSSGGYAILTLQDSQEVRLKGITLGNIKNDNFVFLSAESVLSTSEENHNNYSIITGLSIGLGVIFLGLCYTVYASIYHVCPFSRYNTASQNEEEPNHIEQQHVKSIVSAPQIVEASLVSTSGLELTPFSGHHSSILGQE